jgi:hypothetical protein
MYRTHSPIILPVFFLLPLYDGSNGCMSVADDSFPPSVRRHVAVAPTGGLSVGRRPLVGLGLPAAEGVVQANDGEERGDGQQYEERAATSQPSTDICGFTPRSGPGVTARDIRTDIDTSRSKI